MKPLLACLAIPFLTSSLFGQEAAGEKAYLLASANPPRPVGLTLKGTKSNAMKDFKMSIKVLGKERKSTMNRSDNEEVKREYLAQNKIRVSFLKNRSFKKDTMSGPPEGEETIGVEEGKTIIFEKKEGTWTGKLEKGKIDPSNQAAFDEEVNERIERLNKSVEGSLEMFGAKPRKIGEQWEVDPKNLPWMNNIKIKGGKMTVKFVKVKKFNGEDCAVLKADFDLNGEMLEDNMEGFPVKLEGSVRSIRSMKYFMDYKSTGTMTMALKGEMTPQPGMVASILMEGEMELDSKKIFIEQKES